MVSNLTAAQRPGTKLVDISCDVTAGMPTVTIPPEVSVDGGATLNVPVTAASGDIGAGVAGARLAWAVPGRVGRPAGPGGGAGVRLRFHMAIGRRCGRVCPA